MREKIIYVAVIIVSISYLLIGNQIAMQGSFQQEGGNDGDFRNAVVTKILDRTTTPVSFGSEKTLEIINIIFEARLTGAQDKGTLVEGRQMIEPYLPTPANMKEVAAGDKVLLVNSFDMENESSWALAEYLRSDTLLILGILFAVCLLIFGRMKGFNTLLSLMFTCLSIFTVFIPAILSGKNIYLWTFFTCAFIIIMTLMLVNGANRKSLAAGIGCGGGILVAALITFIVNKIVHLTGIVDEHSFYLMNLPVPIDLKALVFSAVIIGALGAVMDVAVDIAVSLREISLQVTEVSLRTIFKSGITIGRDILGTMTNTLILAYIGSSLSVVLLLCAYDHSFLYLMNMEMIVVEIIQALAGSFGLLFAAPITSLVCGVLYTKNLKSVFQ